MSSLQICSRLNNIERKYITTPEAFVKSSAIFINITKALSYNIICFLSPIMTVASFLIASEAIPTVQTLNFVKHDPVIYFPAIDSLEEKPEQE